MKQGRVREQLFDYLLVLDFEATCDNNRSFGPQEIIEWPTILYNTRTGKVEDEFHEYIKPIKIPKLTKFCTELTGITQEMVDAGKTCSAVFTEYEAWLTKHGLIGGKENKTFAIITCGDWDLRAMAPKQFALFGGRVPLPVYFKEWINIKKCFDQFYKKRARGMAGMLKDLGIPLTGRHHSGIDDCRNILKIVPVSYTHLTLPTNREV
eukprot:TRINITY_DN7800_c0_g1_i1.p1 TRINITY_DN7800_c0_g1~~TRINITY_DN7800_c0_g1_i1.p1  ORF type:complete len:208 (-),score=26.70 TRINITY_DN7800_c0_g1_i1:9-632(-)